MGTCHFQASTQQKSLDRSFLNFAQLTMSARPLNMPTRSTAVAVKPRSHANSVKERRLEVVQQEKRSEKQIQSECANAAAGSFFVPVSLPDNKISNIWRQ
jgi:hypothetical protein